MRGITIWRGHHPDEGVCNSGVGHRQIKGGHRCLDLGEVEQFATRSKHLRCADRIAQFQIRSRSHYFEGRPQAGSQGVDIAHQYFQRQPAMAEHGFGNDCMQVFNHPQHRLASAVGQPCQRRADQVRQVERGSIFGAERAALLYLQCQLRDVSVADLLQIRRNQCGVNDALLHVRRSAASLRSSHGIRPPPATIAINSVGIFSQSNSRPVL